nr:hypothetical protein [Sphingobium sp. CCH11-B1]
MEVDGASHDQNIDHGAGRDAHGYAQGFTSCVLRMTM